MASSSTGRKRSPAMDLDSLSLFPSSKRARKDAVPYEETGYMNSSTTAPPSPLTPPSVFSAPSQTHTSRTSRISRREKKYSCEYEGCAKSFDRPVRLEAHIRSHKNERPYLCTHNGCDKSFIRSEHLKAHIQAKHSDERRFICIYILDGAETECGKAFPTATKLRRHVAAHEDKEQIKCQESGCSKVFRKQDTLQRHIKKDHLHELPFRCTAHITNESISTTEPEECGQSFATPGQLKAHKSRAHLGFKYFCETCQALSRDSEDGRVDTLSLTCAAEPAIGFTTYADLQLHLKTVHPPTCAECGAQCASNRALKAHIDIQHLQTAEVGEENASSDRRNLFACTWPGCERSFTKGGNLKVHVQSVHIKVKQYVCGSFDLAASGKVAGWEGQGCGRGFGTKANLEDHVRTQHLGLRGKTRSTLLRQTGPTVAEDKDTPSTGGDDRTAVGPSAGEIAMLTGQGYDDMRPLACLVPQCCLRFNHDYDLAPHLELTHGWHIDDVNDALTERKVMDGGKFWVGGMEEIEWNMQPEWELHHERELRDANEVGMLTTKDGGVAPYETVDRESRGQDAMGTMDWAELQFVPEGEETLTMGGMAWHGHHDQERSTPNMDGMEHGVVDPSLKAEA